MIVGKKCPCGETDTSKFSPASKYQCKQCASRYARMRVTEYPEAIARIKRDFLARHPGYFSGRYASSSDEDKGKIQAISKRWYLEHPEANHAHNKIKALRKRGLLVNAVCCSVCDKECRTVAHHEDYSQPLEVMFVCRSCHKIIHLPLDKTDEV